MELLIWCAAFLGALLCLVKASDFFLEGAETVGRAFGFPPFLVGVSLVAVGTSLPELLASISAVLVGASEVATGTAVGSNVTNLLLVLSVAAMVGGGLTVKHEIVRVDLPFLFGSALLLTLCSLDGRIGRAEGALSLAALGAYLVYAATSPEIGASLGPGTTPTGRRPRATARTWVVLGVSAVFLQVGAHLTVVSLERLSDLLDVGGEVLAATLLALGTSLPELSVTLRSAQAGKPEIAVGNVLGSNIFNALGVIGVPALIGPLTVPEDVRNFALPAMLGATILGFFVLQEREMTRWDGWLLSTLYAVFIGHLYGWI